MRIGYESGRQRVFGVLLIHGLSGTPEEVRPAAEALQDRFRVLCPWLAGHGTSPYDLARTPWTAWWESAREAYAFLSRRVRKIAVVGLSLGALLALRLAARFSVCGVAAFGAPLWIRDPRFAGIALFRFFQRRTRELCGGVRREGVFHLTYPWVSTDTLYELKKLQGIVRKELTDIRAPVFLGHGALDAKVPAFNVRRLSRKVTHAAFQRVQLYPSSDHVVTLDVDAGLLKNDLKDFLRLVFHEGKREPSRRGKKP